MIGLLKSDWIQLRTTRTAMWFAIATLVFTVGPVIAGLAISAEATDFEGAVAMAFVVGMPLFCLFSVVAVTGNNRHRVTIIEQLVNTSRLRIMLSKVIVYGACGAAIALLAAGLVAGVLSVWPGAGVNFERGWAALLAWTVFAGAAGAVLGVAFARLVRVQVAAVIILLAYFFIVSPGLSALQFAFDLDFLSLQPANVLLDLFGEGDHSRGVAALILCGWIALLGGAAILLDRRRDLN